MQICTPLRTLTFALALTLSALMLCASFATSQAAANTGSLSADKTTFTFTASANKVNTIKVSYTAFALVVEDTVTSGTTVTAGTGCTQVNVRKISCPTTTILSINMDMGNLNDKLTMGSTALIPAHVTTTVENVGAVTGGDGPMVMYVTDGGTGNVIGGPGYDNIYVTDVVKNIDGGGKDDQITIVNNITTPLGSEFSYWVQGGPGADLIDASNSTASLEYLASEGTDVVLGSKSADEFTFGFDRDLIFANGGDDRIYDQYQGDPDESEKSEIWGGPGNDTFIDKKPYKHEVTHFEGGPGYDRVTYMTDSAEPGWLPDIMITFDDNADDGAILFGGESEGDHIHLSVENIGDYEQLQDNDQMGGNDQLYGSAKPNSIFGHGGNDLIEGAAGDDTLHGGNGDDTIGGGSGTDSGFGESGSDSIIATGDGDTYDGGTGSDMISYDGAGAGVTIDLTGTAGSDTVTLIENVFGSKHADTITGNDDPNSIDGGEGNDVITTVGGGVDEINCGEHQDENGNDVDQDVVTMDENDVLVDPENCETVNVE